MRRGQKLRLVQDVEGIKKGTHAKLKRVIKNHSPELLHIKITHDQDGNVLKRDGLYAKGEFYIPKNAVEFLEDRNKLDLQD
jgi:hypothetical protein